MPKENAGENTYVDWKLHLERRKERLIARGARSTNDPFIVQIPPSILYNLRTGGLISKDSTDTEKILGVVSRSIARLGDSESIPRAQVVRVSGDPNHLTLVTFYPPGYDDPVADLLERSTSEDDRSDGATHNID